MKRTEKLNLVAKHYGVSPQTVRIMVQQNMIPGAYCIKNNKNRMYIFDSELIGRVAK